MSTQLTRARKSGPRRLARGTLAAVALLAGSNVVATPAAEAATTFTLVSLGAKVTGTSVSSTAVIKGSAAAMVSQYGICVRSASGADVDFPLQSNVAISTSGTTFWQQKSFAAGRYTYAVCLQIGNTWSQVGSTQSFTVTSSARPSETPPSETPPSDSSTMPVGNLPGWKQVFKDDFTSSVARGSLLSSAYGNSWYAYSGYNDTSGHGRYNPNAVMSTTGGALDWYLHTANGQHNVSAMIPRVPATGWGQKYGRYSLRFRSDVMPGYKLAFMLWPDSDNWGEGEVDFPEAGALEPGSGNNIYANLYKRGNTAAGTPGSTTGFKTNTNPTGTGWHTATIEWAPNSLTYILDGKTLGTLKDGVPNTSFHLVLQVETALGSAPSNSVAGHLQVDWVTMYSYAP